MTILLLKNRWAGCVMSGLLLACSPNREQHQDINRSVDTASLVNLVSATSDDGKFKVRLFAEDSLRTGYQDIYFKLMDQKGGPLEKAQLVVTPQMNMGMMVHGAPVVQPKAQIDGFFKAGVAFIMPTSQTSGHAWSIDLSIKEHGLVDHLKFPLRVAAAQKPTTLAFDAGGEGRFFLSLENAESLSSGKQVLTFLLNKVDKDQFPAADGFELVLKARMPDMGHESKADEPADALGGGEYRTELSLPMAGFWEIQVEVLKNGNKVSTEPVIFSVNISQ